MFKKMLWILGLIGLSVIPMSVAHAKIFRNAYVSFELPENWKCDLDNTEWVCKSQDPKETKEAIIILTAKQVGPTDAFDKYTAHLGQPLTNGAKTGSTPSKIIYPPKESKFNDQPWIDGMHQGSEVQNYMTRYLATIKDRIAVLVTFSAHKDKWAKYSSDFFNAVKSLRVVASSMAANNPEIAGPGGDIWGQNANANLPEGVDQGMSTGGSHGFHLAPKQKMMFVGIASAIAALLALFLMRAKK